MTTTRVNPVRPQQAQVQDVKTTKARDKREDVSMEEFIEQLEINFLDLRRAFAGYSSLAGAYATLMNELQPGQRAKGMPIFEHKATVNGRDSVVVVTDLKSIPQEYLAGVLGPLIHLHGSELAAAVNAMSNIIANMKEMISVAIPAGFGDMHNAVAVKEEQDDKK
jgi:hypothetical protein